MRYTCNFGFEQPVYNGSYLPETDDAFNPAGGALSSNPDCQLSDDGPCWVGEATSRPTPDSGLINMTTTVAGDGEQVDDDKTVVSFFTDNRDGGVEFNPQQYTCVYGFSQRITDYSSEIGSFDNYYYDRNGEQITDVQDHLESGSDAWFIEGVEGAGNLDIERGGLIVPGGSGNNASEQRDWLDSNTDVFTVNSGSGDLERSTNPLWPMYPTSLDNQYDDGQTRHPGIEFDLDPETCPNPHQQELERGC